MTTPFDFIVHSYHHRKSLFLVVSFILLATANSIAVSYIPHLRIIVWAFFTGLWTCALLALATVFLVHDIPPSNPLQRIKPLAFTSPTRWQAEIAAAANSFVEKVPLHTKSPAISTALDALLASVQRDFISSWFSKITPTGSFPGRVEILIRHIVSDLLTGAQGVDAAEIVVGRIVPLLTTHLQDFSAADRAVRGNHRNNLTESEELDMAIASKYREGKLHPATGKSYSDMKLAQQEYLRGVVDNILSQLLPENERRSRVLKTIAREVIACALLYPVLSLLSDPDTWNQLIVALGKSTLQDRKNVRKLRVALDKHATPPRPMKSDRSSQPQHFIRLTPRDDERTFERFVRSIRLCNNLSDARRLRNEITAQLKRDTKVEGDKDSWQVYIRRLETGKRLIDQKVAFLSGEVEGPKKTESDIVTQVAKTSDGSRLESATLEEVMMDSTGLSYFMEYMDRQNRMSLVQFWLVVNGLRNPLEDDISSSDEDALQSSSTIYPIWTPSDRNDIAQIHDAYLCIPELLISDRSKRAVKEFLKPGDVSSQSQYVKARSAILRAQTAVYEQMNKKHFPGFRSSDLFYKYLASDESGGGGGVGAPASARDSSDITRNEMNTSPIGADDAVINPLSGSVVSVPDEKRGGAKIRTQAGSSTPDRNMVEAMEAALNDIIDEPSTGVNIDISRLSPVPSSNEQSDSPRGSMEYFGGGPPSSKGTTVKSATGHLKPPSIASLGLLTESRDSVFQEELFPEENRTAIDESLDEYHETENGKGQDDDNDEIHLAAPGDLGLAEAITKLTYDIEKLFTQEAVIDSLYRKAELTNNTVELRILKKSKGSLQREIRRKELQKQQYIIQESDNSLFGRSTVNIKSTIVGSENGQDYALYIIEVKRQGGEQLPAAQWAVARRYSEFFQLHQTLKHFDSVKELEFPRRRVVMKLQKDFLEKRRLALDRYLKSLLLIPEVCRSLEFRAFLSQQNISGNTALPVSTSDSSKDVRKDLMTRLYDSIADGMEDVLGNLPLLDQLSANLLSASSSPVPSKADISEVAEAEAELSAFEDKEAVPFVKPICDLFLEVFELNRKSNWLRGRAVVVVLHQLLGGTIEKKVREYMSQVLEEESVVGYLEWVMATVWPDGALRQKAKERTQREKSKTRLEASIIMASLIPDLSASVVGRANARSASKRLFGAINNHRLNTSILYMMLDEVVSVVFGNLPATSSSM